MLVNSLDIQVDNLCQFLPQDRVASFAKLNEFEVLLAFLRFLCCLSYCAKQRKLLARKRTSTSATKTLLTGKAASIRRNKYRLHLFYFYFYFLQLIGALGVGYA